MENRTPTPEELAQAAKEVRLEILRRVEAVEDEIGLIQDAIDSATSVYDYTEEESDELFRILKKLDNYFEFES